jgi:hypothetical protein
MSIIWLNDNLIETENLGEQNSQDAPCDCSMIIITNGISVLIAAAYIYFYKLNKKLHNSQSKN